MKKKTPFKKFEPRQEKSERKGISCFECGGIGHIAPNCGNLKNKKKGKVMAAIWSGSDDSNEREIKRLEEENQELSIQVDHFSEKVLRTMENEDKLRKELDLSRRNEEGLKRELEEAK